MKIVASRESLYRGFQRLSGVVGSGTQQPLYRHVKVQATGGVLDLSATDLEVGLTLRVPDVEVEEEGAALLPHDRVSPLLGATRDEKVTLVEEDGAVTMETEDSDFRILSEDPSEFAALPELPEDGVVEIDPDVLRYMVRRAVFACADEKGRYALHGVLCVIGKEETIEFVAADGARLAHVRKKIGNAEGVEAEFIVMREGLEQLGHLADYGTGPVRFATIEGRLIGENDAGRMVCQLVEGQFPNYREVIPTESKISVQLDTDRLLNAVRRASYLTTEETRVVEFRFSSDGLAITAESPDVGRAEVRMPLEYDGEEAGIAFNPEYLQDMLSIVERETVKMRFTDRRSPCVIKSGLDYTYVVSPVIREEAQV
ncbi:MAG: DNA polymerase III subunit beta [Candidatus Brocadiaceae bacterium]|jgi:DNA polymerase-3 subunit beta